MEQFSPLLGLSSRVMENCDGDMLIRSGKPSSGIRRQVVTGPLLMCPRDVSSRVKSDDSKLCRTAFLLHTHTSGVQRVLDGITALRVTITKNRFWNTIGSLTAVIHVHSYSISLSLFPPPFHSFSFSRIYQYLSRLAGRSLVFLVEKHRWRRWRGAVQSSELRGFPIYDEKRYDNVQRLILQ